MLKQKQLYHAASALADAIADSCRDGALDLALEQLDALFDLIVAHRESNPPSVVRSLHIDGSAA